eukprot:m.201581 g.201581  ORF g.201581 m.201581 type:complete len:184 (+) comp10680_c0_seq2:25-576(+)
MLSHGKITDAEMIPHLLDERAVFDAHPQLQSGAIAALTQSINNLTQTITALDQRITALDQNVNQRLDDMPRLMALHIKTHEHHLRNRDSPEVRQGRLLEIPRLQRTPANAGAPPAGLNDNQLNPDIGTEPNDWVQGSFPRSDAELNTLTNAKLNQLQWFYCTQFAGASLNARREAFRRFVCGY